MGRPVVTGHVPSRPPGAWLRIVARWVFDERVVSGVVQPTLDDLQSEWLDAGASVVGRWRARWLGYLAFWSLVLMAPVAFKDWPSRRFTPPSFSRMFRRSHMSSTVRMRLTVLLCVLGFGAGYATSRLRQPQYESSAVLRLLPPSVHAGLVDDVGPGRPLTGDRLQTLIQVVLSRTRLERLIRDFNLYESDQQSRATADVVEAMRQDIAIRPMTPAIGDQVRVSYTGSSPEAALKVAERLAAMVKDEDMQERDRRAESTLVFLESQLESARRELDMAAAKIAPLGVAPSISQQLEFEVLQATYKTLLEKRTPAKVLVDLDRRQIGGQLVLLDAARLPERPVGPTRLAFTLGGGAIGLVIAAVIAAADALRRLLRGRRRDLATVAG